MMTRKFSADECVKYMKNKYGKDFSFIRTVDKFQPTVRSLEIFVSCPELSGRDIYVVEEDTGGDLRFSDNFPAVMYEDEVRSLLTGLAEKVYGSCKVLYTLPFKRIIPGSPSSLEEYISDSLSCISFTLILPPDADTARKDELAQSLAAALCEKKAVCSFRIFYTADAAVYKGIASFCDIPHDLSWYTAFGSLSTDGEVLTSESWR